jgi:hypothetical protein
MTDLIHMAREREEIPGQPVEEKPFYPYGLALNLDMEALEALGIEEMPSAGTEFHLEAHGCITHSSTCDPDADGDVDGCCLTLQITHLGFEHGEEPERKDTDRDHAQRMYGPKVA